MTTPAPVTEEQYVCEECGTVVPTAEEFCPNCGAPLEKFADTLDIKSAEDDDLDLSDEALHKGIDLDGSDGTPLSLEALREEEEGEDTLDDYEKGNNGDE